MTLPRQDPEVDALRTDRYLESLLAAADRRADDVPADIALDEAVRDVAARLQRGLVRVHPSFRFEERLAGRLAGAAASMRLAPAAGAESEIGIINTGAVRAAAASGATNGPDGSSFDPLGDEPDEEADEGLRPLLIGGALTSAALSLAGAAFVAWRRSRPESRATRSPMARAVRAARAARDTSRAAGQATAGARVLSQATAGARRRLG
jgi:hypothetical protein